MIPKLIHQTCKSANQLTPEMRSMMQSWIQINPDYMHVFYDDAQCLRAVAEYRPDCLEVYQLLRKPVERADLFRYIIVWALGGVYSDIDTECVKPISEFVSENSQFVVGLEGAFKNSKDRKKFGFVHNVQYAQWTFAATRGHPILDKLIRMVKKNITFYLSGQIVSNAHVETIAKTGPGVFTEAVNWGLSKPWIRSGVTLHDIAVFGAGQVHSNSPPLSDPRVAVIHKFMYSWKPKGSKEDKHVDVAYIVALSSLGVLVVISLALVTVFCFRSRARHFETE
jgi:hypothetical protein